MYQTKADIKLLSAPHIAGLLPATVTTHDWQATVTAHSQPSITLLPTPEEIDLDIALTFQRCYVRLFQTTQSVGFGDQVNHG